MTTGSVDIPGRVIAYVDGFNLYFGLKSQGLEGGLWLDIPRLLSRFLLPNQTLLATKYFTSRISGPPDKAKRQTTYLEALISRPGVQAFFGQYTSETRSCRKCGQKWIQNNEKMTDVNIRVHLNEIKRRFRIKEVAIDPWNATQLSVQLQGDGFEVVTYGQGFRDMTAPTKELEKLVISGKLRHGGHAVLRWMASNVSVELDAAGNVKPSRKKSVEKIDGIVAAVMGLGRALAEPERPKMRMILL